MSDPHGNRAFYCDEADRYVSGRTKELDCPFCGVDLTGEWYEHVQKLLKEHQNDA